MKPGAEAAHWFARPAASPSPTGRSISATRPSSTCPCSGLIDPDYITGRAALVSPEQVDGHARKAGDPPFQKRARLLPPSDGIENGTSHISVDRRATATPSSMTTTIEDGFGARLMTKSGFLLNNELTDFNFVPSEDGKPVANRVEAGKRPRSSMAPTHRLRRLRPALRRRRLARRQPDHRLCRQDPGRDPRLEDGPAGRRRSANFGSRNGPTELEDGTEAEGWKAALEAKGHEVQAAWR